MTASFRTLGAVLAATLSLNVLAAPLPTVRITEVDPGGSGTLSYAVDWFELTNTGSSTLTLSGWKMDDNSFAAASAVALNGITSILAGESVIFLETSASNAASKIASFKSTWFGSNVPAGLQFGYYSGSGVSLGTSGDGVIVFDSANTQLAKVSFGAATSGATFDNAAGLDNATLATVATLGVNGAFAGSDGRIGSPGRVTAPAPVPLPAAAWLMAPMLAGLGLRRRQGAA